MKALIILAVLGLLAACSHPARQIDCEGHLRPINPPTPVVKAATTPAVPPTPPAPAPSVRGEAP